MKPINKEELKTHQANPKKANLENSQLFFFKLAVINGEFTILFLDENAEKVIGYTKNEIINQKSKGFQLIDERNLIYIMDTFNKAIETPQQLEFETIIIHKNGHLVLLKNKCISFYNSKCEIQEIIGYAEVISELDIENYSKTSISKLINVAYNLGLVGTFYYDISMNTMLWSDEVKKMHGYDIEPTNEEFFSHVTAKEVADMKHIIQRVVESKIGYQALYKFYRKIDKTYRNILCIIFPIVDKNNSLIALSGNMIDLFDDSVKIEPNNNSDQIDKIHPVKDLIFINHLNQYIKINYNEILAISSLRDYVQIFTTNRKAPYTYYAKLYKIKESLPEDIFVQTHRSHIVNIQKIQKIADNNIFINDLKFPISRNYKAQLKEILK